MSLIQSKKYKVSTKNNLEDLEKKLLALDSLMHQYANTIELDCGNKHVIENYSKSTPFTKNNNTFSN